jgi:hypothetical protein
MHVECDIKDACASYQILTILGQLLLIANTPSTLLPVSSVPDCASNIIGSTPKHGEQHDPGC